MRRRDVLSAVAGAGALAGCLGREAPANGANDDTGDGDADSGDGGSDDGGDGDGGVREASIETVGTDCGTGENDSASLAEDDGVLVLTGRIPSNTPCYEAVLAEHDLSDGVLSVTVDVEPDDSEGCVDCLGEVRYEARFDPAEPVDRVALDHATAGTHDLYRGIESGIARASIGTTRTDCADGDDDRISVDGGGPVVVEGVLPAPDPCHGAALTGYDLADGTLSLTVDVRSTREGEEGCPECEGAVEYRAAFELVGDAAVDRVAVDHATGGEHEADAGGDGASASVEATAIETTATECAGGEEERVDATRDGEAVVVDGRRFAPTPCHDAVLADVSVDGSTLALTVDVERREGVCTECVGAVEYEARVDLANGGAVDEVAVDHVDGGEHVVDPGE